MKKTIELGRGIGDEVLFGSSFDEVKKILGEPDEVENSQLPNVDGEDSGDTTAWVYDEFGATLYFDEIDEWRLGTVEVDNDEFLLSGQKLIGKSFDEVQTLLKSIGITDVLEEEVEAEDGDEEEIRLLFSEEKNINLWFEGNICTEIQWSSII